MWADYRKERQQKRRENREYSTAALMDLKVQFTEHNHGAHLIITTNKATIDFWPGTGKWKVRGSSNARHGLKLLLRRIKSDNGGSDG